MSQTASRYWVIDPGARVTSVWSSSTGILSHPSLVAVDVGGAVRCHGGEAIRMTRRHGDLLSARRPFVGGDVADETAARAFLRWMMSGVGHVPRHGALLFPLPPSTTDEAVSRWKRLAQSVGARPVILDRLIAMALGLGLSVETERAHLLIEVRSDFTEVGVVSRGVVVAEHLIRDEPESWGQLVDVVLGLLLDLDPDLELDIREEGLQLTAPDPQSELLARLLADGVGIPVLVTRSDHHPVLLGARQIGDSLLHFAAI